MRTRLSCLICVCVKHSNKSVCEETAASFPTIVHQTSFMQLSQRAGEIYNSFLSSKATMPVNIDSQAQLADDVLTSPRPDMFKMQQLQVSTTLLYQSGFCVRSGVSSLLAFSHFAQAYWVLLVAIWDCLQKGSEALAEIETQTGVHPRRIKRMQTCLWV